MKTVPQIERKYFKLTKLKDGDVESECMNCGCSSADHDPVTGECWHGAGYGNRCECRKFEAVDSTGRYLVWLTIDNQRFQVSPEPLDKETAEWFRRQFAHALYKFGALEGAVCDPKKNSKK